MGKKERQAYLKAIRSRYRQASKKAKGAILDEFCAVCGCQRKYAIRLLNRRGKPRQPRPQGASPSTPHQNCSRHSNGSGSPATKCARRSSRPPFLTGYRSMKPPTSH